METLKELKEKQQKAELRLNREIHKLNRLKNRLSYYEKGERAKRTHLLCNIGGAVLSLAPPIKKLSKSEIYELMERIFSLPEVEKIIDFIREEE